MSSIFFRLVLQISEPKFKKSSSVVQLQAGYMILYNFRGAVLNSPHDQFDIKYNLELILKMEYWPQVMQSLILYTLLNKNFYGVVFLLLRYNKFIDQQNSILHYSRFLNIFCQYIMDFCRIHPIILFSTSFFKNIIIFRCSNQHGLFSWSW